MGDYFNPLRRKIGVVTLVMACVLAAGWVRSCVYIDYLSGRVRPGDKQIDHLVSLNQQIGYMVSSSDLLQLKYPRCVLRSWRLNALHGPFIGGNVNWWWNSNGFRVIDVKNETTGNILYRGLAIPYWSIVLPMALLSAWLLLNKPRVANQKAVTKPVHEKVT